MIIISCPDCGKPLLWHKAHEHRCAHNHGAAPGQKPQKSKPAKKPTTKPVMKTEARSVSSPSSRRIEPPSPSPSDDWPSAEQAIKHIMQARNCSREEALQELRKGINDGRVATHIVVAEDIAPIDLPALPKKS